MPVNPYATRLGEILRKMKSTKGPAKTREEAQRRFKQAAHEARTSIGVPHRKGSTQKSRSYAGRKKRMAQGAPRHARRRGNRGMPPSVLRSFRHPSTRDVPGVMLLGGFRNGFYPDQSGSYVSGARSGGVTNTGSMQGISAKLPSGSAFVGTAVQMNGMKRHLLAAGVIDG